MDRPTQAKVILGCYIRGKPVAEGTVLRVVAEPRGRDKFEEDEISWAEFADLIMFKNVVAYDERAMNGGPAAPPEPEAQDESEDEEKDEPAPRHHAKQRTPAHHAKKHKRR